MRKVIFAVANSLDNYIAGKDDAIDWLVWSDDVSAIMTEFWKAIDTALFGRKTYEATLGLDNAEGAALTAGVKNYLFSRTMKESPESFELVSEDAGEFVRKLKQQDGKDICCMGGGELARSLLEADVIDEIAINIHPVLLGSGVPLFHELKRKIQLELVDCRTLQGGCVFATYRVER
ncbi:MAG: dihydrofolate reductase family protein [Planctomycetota bacterium]